MGFEDTDWSYYQIYSSLEGISYILHMFVLGINREDWGQHNKCFKILEPCHMKERFNSLHMVPEGRNEAEA